MSTYESPSTCVHCDGTGTLKTMRIKEVDPEVTIIIFECDNCKTRDLKYFDSEEDKGYEIKIRGRIIKKEDMDRQMSINSKTVVTIIKGTFEYSYQSINPGVYNVEGFLLMVVDDLKNTLDNEIKDEIIENMTRLMEEKGFEIMVEDTSGCSRVSRVDRGVYEMNNDEIEEFNDGNFIHEKITKG